MITILDKTQSLASQFIAELRDEEIQKDRTRFRKNMERLGEIFAYEISKKLHWQDLEVTTSLGIANASVLSEQPILATILRAGLPLHQGLLNFFDNADCAYISAYRKTKKNNDFVIEMEYVSTPEVEDRIVIVSDPMLATGSSMVLTCKELMSKGKIKTLHIVSVIASVEGVEYVKKNLPKAHLWLGSVDEELTTKAYIVPGLGDAGDLAFGEKM
jgi:uracil phosphoribosyltransferase